MTARFRRVAVFVGAAALAAGARVGVAATQGDATNRSGGAIQKQGGPGGRFDLSTVADKLGVSEAELQQAMRKARPTDPSAAAGPDAMFAAVADALGASVDKVRAAFASVMPQGGPGGAGGQSAPPSGSQTAPDGQAAPQA